MKIFVWVLTSIDTLLASQYRTYAYSLYSRHSYQTLHFQKIFSAHIRPLSLFHIRPHIDTSHVHTIAYFWTPFQCYAVFPPLIHGRAYFYLLIFIIFPTYSWKNKSPRRIMWLWHAFFVKVYRMTPQKRADKWWLNSIYSDLTCAI